LDAKETILNSINTPQTKKETLSEKSKKVGATLIGFYETMKKLETDEHKEGKKATMLVMTINDIEEIFNP